MIQSNERFLGGLFTYGLKEHCAISLWNNLSYSALIFSSFFFRNN